MYETGFLQLGQRPELWLALQLLQAKALQCLHCQKGPIGGEHWFEVFATQSSFCAIFPAYTRVSARPRKRLTAFTTSPRVRTRDRTSLPGAMLEKPH